MLGLVTSKFAELEDKDRAQGTCPRGRRVRRPRPDVPQPAVRILEHGPRQRDHRGRPVGQAATRGRRRRRRLGVTRARHPRDPRAALRRVRLGVPGRRRCADIADITIADVSEHDDLDRHGASRADDRRRSRRRRRPLDGWAGGLRGLAAGTGAGAIAGRPRHRSPPGGSGRAGEPRTAAPSMSATEGMDALADAWLPPMVHPDRRADAAIHGTAPEMVGRATPAQHARQIHALLTRPDATPLLGTITVPTLVVVGREDAVEPGRAARAHRCGDPRRPSRGRRALGPHGDASSNPTRSPALLAS